MESPKTSREAPAQAGEIVFSVLLRLSSAFGEIGALRHTLELANADLRSRVTEDIIRSLPLLYRQEPLQRLFAEGGPFAGFVGTIELVTSMVHGQLENVSRLRDKATVIMGHSALDSIVTDLLQATALAAPNKWHKWIAKKTVEFDAVRESSLASIEARLLEKELDSLERSSLLTRLDRLLAVSEPDKEWYRNEVLEYDRDRIEAIDQRRHDIAHGRSDGVLLSSAEDDFRYVQVLAANLWSLVVLRFDLMPALSAATPREAPRSAPSS